MQDDATALLCPSTVSPFYLQMAAFELTAAAAAAAAAGPT